MTKSVIILNGPNLNLLGTRQPEIYGSDTLQDIEKRCAELAKSLRLECAFHQSNHEGELVDLIQKARSDSDGLIVNPAALGHTSVALYDALVMYGKPILEVHISNIYARESFRRHTYVSASASGVIAGCGALGYELALRRMAELLAEKS